MVQDLLDQIAGDSSPAAASLTAAPSALPTPKPNGDLLDQIFEKSNFRSDIPQLSQRNPTLAQRAVDARSSIRKSGPVEALLGKTPDETAQMLEPRPTGLLPNVVKAAKDFPAAAEFSPASLMDKPTTVAGGINKVALSQLNLENLAMVTGIGEVWKAAKLAKDTPKIAALTKALVGAYFTSQGTKGASELSGKVAGNPNEPSGDLGTDIAGIGLNGVMALAPVGEAILSGKVKLPVRPNPTGKEVLQTPTGAIPPQIPNGGGLSFKGIPDELLRDKPAKPTVPETQPETEKDLTVIEEIRQLGLKTKKQIQSVFPHLSNEEAAALRNQTWGKQPDAPIAAPAKPAAAIEPSKPSDVAQPPLTGSEPPSEIVKRVSDMSGEDFAKLGKGGFNRINIPLGENLKTKDGVSMLNDAWEKAKADAETAKSEMQKNPTDENIQKFSNLSSKPQFFREALDGALGIQELKGKTPDAEFQTLFQSKLDESLGKKTESPATKAEKQTPQPVVEPTKKVPSGSEKPAAQSSLESSRRKWIDEQRKTNPKFAPDIESWKELLPPKELAEVNEWEDLKYKSVARQGPETGYKPYKLSAKQKARLKELSDKYAPRQQAEIGDKPTPSSPAAKEPWQMTQTELAQRELKKYEDSINSGKPYSAIYNPDFKKTLSKRQAQLKSMTPEQKLDAMKKNWESYHRSEVEVALENGKPVPPEVMAEYPDLKSPPVSRAIPPASPATAPTEPVSPSIKAEGMGKSPNGMTPMEYAADVAKNPRHETFVLPGKITGLSVSPGLDASGGKYATPKTNPDTFIVSDGTSRTQKPYKTYPMSKWAEVVGKLSAGRESISWRNHNRETTKPTPPTPAEKPAAVQKVASPESGDLSSGKLGKVGMGGAKPAEFSNPTIEDLISGNKLSPPREKPAPTIEPQNKETINALSEAVKSALEGFKGWFGAVAGKTFPKTTLADRQLGELGARWISSRIAAKPKAEIYVAEVLGDSGLSARDVGAALTEDNLRSIKAAFGSAGDERAGDVQTLIGKPGSPFKTEREYQDFISNPKFKEVVERHKDLWQATVEPQYREAMRIDPDVELPSRGLQTGARVNLRAVQEGDNARNVVRTVSPGNLLGTMRRKSPFGVQATGAGEAYHTDLHDLMENTFGKQDEIANKNAFEKKLVDTGNAIVGKPGQQVNIKGQPAVPFPLQRQTLMLKGADGTKAVGQNQVLYVNRRLATEYRIGANVDFRPPPGVLSKVNAALNKTAIASGTEATTHVMNLGSALFALPTTGAKLMNDSLLTTFGRADIPVKIVQVIRKSMQDNRAQLAGLSEIGAMKEHFEPTRIWGMRQGSQLIQWMDKNTRLVLDDAYQNLAKQGLVEDSETARREFVNQVGQYNMRAQPYLMGQMRKLGISPFVTAGKNFNALAVREATLSPGVKASSVPASIALKANLLSKWVGSAAIILTANYLLTKDKGGGVMGRPGTPLGYVDTGSTDKNGRNVLVNVLNITGQGRALRVTGLKGFIDAERMGLPASNGIDTAGRDIINSAIGPWAGPAARFAVGAASGYPTAINVGRAYPVTPPGQSQHLSDFKNAVINTSPIGGGIQKMMQPQGQGWWEIVKSQFPRLVPQAGRSASMNANYPEIVQKAQANGFMEDVIHAARSVPPDQRHNFLQAQISRLPAELQSKAWKETEYRRVMSR